MLFGHAMIDTDQTAFEVGEKALDRVGVNLTSLIFALRVIYR